MCISLFSALKTHSTLRKYAKIAHINSFNEAILYMVNSVYTLSSNPDEAAVTMYREQKPNEDVPFATISVAEWLKMSSDIRNTGRKAHPSPPCRRRINTHMDGHTAPHQPRFLQPTTGECILYLTWINAYICVKISDSYIR